jgi:hypothetical protein
MSMVCKYIRTYSLLCLWVISAGLIVANYQTNSSPQLSYSAVDTTESVLVVLSIMVTELIVLYLLLKPWQIPRSGISSLVTLGMFTIWTFLSMILAMHGSNSVFIHL